VSRFDPQSPMASGPKVDRFDPQTRMISRATALASAGVAVRALWSFLPTYPGSGGFVPLIDFRAPALVWGAQLVSLGGLTALAIVAVKLLRRTPRSRAIAGGVLITMSVAVSMNTIGTLLYSIEYVREVGDFYDVGPAGMWLGFVLGVVSLVAFAIAGASALAADRTTSIAAPEMPSTALPAPPPPG
jgi:hypothetical protein